MLKHLMKTHVFEGFSFKALLAPTLANLPDVRPPWPHLGPSWGHLGPSWAIFGHLGAILGPSWAILKPSWRHFGPSGDHLGAILSHLGPILGPSWTILAPSWDRLGATLGPLGASGVKLAFSKSSVLHAVYLYDGGNREAITQSADTLLLMSVTKRMTQLCVRLAAGRALSAVSQQAR